MRIFGNKGLLHGNTASDYRKIFIARSNGIHLRMMATDFDKTKSNAPIYAVRIALTIRTIHVALIRSRRLGQVTLIISPLTSLQKTGIFANTPNILAMMIL